MGYVIRTVVGELQKQSDNCQVTWFHRYILSQLNFNLLRSIYTKLETHFKYHGVLDTEGTFKENKFDVKVNEYKQSLETV